MKNQNDLFARFEKKADELLKGEEGKGILIALSGGADSTALLLLFEEYARKRDLRLYALHVHHGLREEEADRDERFCAELCEKRSIPFECVRVDVRNWARTRKKGIEESARILRYQALNEKSAEINALIATAHHADDLLETAVFRLSRGCASAGLAGLHEKRGRIIRPLLQFSHEELVNCLLSARQDWVTDSTNGEEICARNLLRLRVTPVLKEICSSPEKSAYRLARQIEEDEAFLGSLLPASADGEELRALPPPLLKRMILRLYAAHFASLPEEERPQLENVHLQKLCELICSGEARGGYGKSVSLPGGVRAVYDRTGLSFSDGKKAFEPYELTLSEGRTLLPGDCFVIYLTKKKRFSDFFAKNEKIHNLFMKAALNSDTIDGRLTVRCKKPNDRLRCKGMTHSVSKLIAELCPDSGLRKSYPVICDGKGVIWVPGRPPRDGCEARDPEESKETNDSLTNEIIYIEVEVIRNGIS